MIGKRQKEVLEYIKSFSSKKGYFPSLEEIRNYFNFKSISTAHYHISRLEEDGYLKRGYYKSRSFEINNSIIHESSIKKSPEFISLPILGGANCGPAEIFATESPQGYLRVSKSIIRNNKNLFVLRADGDSMNKANIKGENIQNGDFVIINPEDRNPINGNYVLSVIDGCANIKRFQQNKKSGEIMLVSESTKNYTPTYLSSKDNFMINGKVVGVIKK